MKGGMEGQLQEAKLCRSF